MEQNAYAAVCEDKKRSSFLYLLLAFEISTKISSAGQPSTYLELSDYEYLFMCIGLKIEKCSFRVKGLALQS